MFFVYIKLFFFLYIINILEVIIGIKPATGDHESNFNNVGSIPFGFNVMGTVIDCMMITSRYWEFLKSEISVNAYLPDSWVYGNSQYSFINLYIRRKKYVLSFLET